MNSANIERRGSAHEMIIREIVRAEKIGITRQDIVLLEQHMFTNLDLGESLVHLCYADLEAGELSMRMHFWQFSVLAGSSHQFNVVFPHGLFPGYEIL